VITSYDLHVRFPTFRKLSDDCQDSHLNYCEIYLASRSAYLQHSNTKYLPSTTFPTISTKALSPDPFGSR
jgi:hypothetical protein